VDLNIKAVKENLNAMIFGLIEPLWLKDIPENLGM